MIPEEQSHHPSPPRCSSFPHWVTAHKPDLLNALLHPTGYFIHDTLDIIFNYQSRSSWEYLVHHAMVSMASTGGYTHPRAQPTQVSWAMAGQAGALPSAPPWLPGRLCINKARAPGGAGRLPASAPSAWSQTGCRAERGKSWRLIPAQGGVTGPGGIWLSILVFSKLSCLLSSLGGGNCAL